MFPISHTHYTYQGSILSIDDLANRTLELGMQAFCIADTNSVTSFVKAFKIAKSKGLKFIPGCEFLIKPDKSVWTPIISDKIAWLKKEMRLKRTTDAQRSEYQAELDDLLEKKESCVNYHKIIVIAINQNGLEDLIRLYNKLEMMDGFSVLDPDSIGDLGRNMICIMAGGSPIEYYAGQDDKLGDIKEFYCSKFFCVYQDASISEQSFLPVVARDVRFARKDQKDAFRVYYSMMHNCIGDIGFDDELFIMNQDELRQKYPHLSDDNFAMCIANLNTIEETVQPSKLPNGDSLRDLSSELEALCVKGWEAKRKGTEYEDESWKRFHYELSIINAKNFSQYFIKIINIINTCKSLNILVGPARGSGGGSEICYLTSIIDVDPLKYGLIFERFLNPGRNGFPDIDLDISADVKYEGKMVPSRNLLVAKLIENGTFSFAGYIQNEVTATTLVLFKTLARYFDLPFEEANRITKDFSDNLSEKLYTGWLKSACETLGLDYMDWWDRMESKMEILYTLNGIPYNTSIAASGVIMSETASILPLNGEVIAFNGTDLESLGYIKFDLLSINTLSQIQYFEGTNINWNDNSDPKVWDSFDEGDTDFAFQFSSSQMQDILRSVRPRGISTLAEINALYRPGPLESGLVEKYKAIKNGKPANLTEEEEIMYGILKREFGEDHCGLLVFQEDVMRICQIGAGFTLSEADDIRKAMGKKKAEVLKPYKQKFIEGWTMGGDPAKIWAMLENYSGYAFNKSHSVAYAIIGYATQRHWVYDRDEVLQFELNNTDKRFDIAINKCRDLKMPIKFPDLSHSGQKNYTIEKGVLHLPGSAPRAYANPADLLFDPDLPSRVILEGILDKICCDRYGLSSLASATLAKFKPTLQAMPYSSNLGQILQSMEQIGAIVSRTVSADGVTTLKLKRERSQPMTVTIRPNNDPEVRKENYKLDMKYFGSARPGIIDDMPFIETSGIINTLDRLKSRIEQSGRDPYFPLRDKLNEHINSISINRKTFQGVVGVFEDAKSYERSTKIWIRFNDKSDIYYVRDPKIVKTVLQAPKDCLVKMTMVYSPFIKRKDCSFVYDFDIMELEVL